MGLELKPADRKRLEAMAEKPKAVLQPKTVGTFPVDWTPEKSAAAWKARAAAEPIVFVIPVKTVSEANVREHWAVKRKRTKAQRDAARLYGGSVQRNPGEWPTPPLAITLTRIGVRALDGDNLQRALKAVRDGIADAIGIDDGDSRIEWRYGQRRGKAREYAVEVRIEKGGSNG